MAKIHFLTKSRVLKRFMLFLELATYKWTAGTDISNENNFEWRSGNGRGIPPFSFAKWLTGSNIKGSVREKLKGYRLTEKNKVLISLVSVASIRRKLLKTSHTEQLSGHTN